MVIRALTIHAPSLTYEVAVPSDELDRLNTAECEELSLGVGAAETKSICTIERVADEVWHEDRQSNARVERPAASASSARTAQNERRAGRAPKWSLPQAART